MDLATFMLGFNLTVIGMGIVFVMLELLAELMRLTCKVFPEKQTPIGAAIKMAADVGKAASQAVKPLTDVARPLTDAAKPLTDAAAQVATGVVAAARPLTQAATGLVVPVAQMKDVHTKTPYQFVATAVLHHYRRKRRPTAVNLFGTVTTPWRR